MNILKYRKKLTLKGYIVITLGLFGHSGDSEAFDEETNKMLFNMQKQKINMSDGIFVINKDGYIGNTTRAEIEYAKENNKAITYLEAIE